MKASTSTYGSRQYSGRFTGNCGLERGRGLTPSIPLKRYFQSVASVAAPALNSSPILRLAEGHPIERETTRFLSTRSCSY
jgi:hypothetical protein